MITEVRVPEVSETVKSGKVVTLLVAAGERVEVDQPLLELETDKAVVEIPSPVAGVVARLTVASGQTVAIGEVIAQIEAAGGDAPPSSAPAAAPEQKPPAPQAAEPPPATASPPAAEPSPSTEAPPAAAPPPATAPRAAASEAEPAPLREVAPASPSVRRLAREIGVDIDQVRGGGPGGRIREEDVKAHAKALLATGGGGATAGAGAAVTGAGRAPRPLIDPSRWGPVTREPLSRVRQVTADALGYAWATIPQVTQHDRADVTELEDFRRRHAARAEAAGGKLTTTAILLKVAAAALRQFPRVNASLDATRAELVLKQYVHIGVAVDTPHGLLVPVIRDVDRKNLLELSVELTRSAELARSRKIPPADLEGGCFTISNLGGIGGTGFTPIVYPPQVAILGVARAATEPVWRDGQFAPRLMLPLSLTYDHRVIDGADGARFLRWIAEALQQPLVLVLDS